MDCTICRAIAERIGLSGMSSASGPVRAVAAAGMAAAGRAGAPAGCAATNASMSRWMIRPLGPVPVTRVRSTPARWASFRASGETRSRPPANTVAAGAATAGAVAGEPFPVGADTATAGAGIAGAGAGAFGAGGAAGAAAGAAGAGAGLAAFGAGAPPPTSALMSSSGSAIDRDQAADRDRRPRG